jgi:hypothetical protein
MDFIVLKQILIIVPVEINVLDHPNLYSNVDLLEFSSHGLIHSTARPITIPIYVINSGLNPVTITVSLSLTDRDLS